MKKNENSYKKSGVNIPLANKLVKHISNLSKKNVKKTKSQKFKDEIGGFGSLFDISNFNGDTYHRWNDFIMAEVKRSQWMGGFCNIFTCISNKCIDFINYLRNLYTRKIQRFA